MITNPMLLDKNWQWRVYSNPKRIEDLFDLHVTGRSKYLIDVLSDLDKGGFNSNKSIYIIHVDHKNDIDYIVPLTEARRLIKISQL